MGPLQDTSASLNSQQLLEKFREEVELGRMESSTYGALKQRYGEENLRIASMGAIQKPDGSVRPVHDGTHGVHVGHTTAQPPVSPGTWRASPTSQTVPGAS